MRWRTALAVLLPAAALVIAGVAAGPRPDRHSGEILGLNPADRTVTLRVSHIRGQEVLVFAVTDETQIRDQDSGEAVPFGELEPGQRASITSRRKDGHRIAIEVVVKAGRKPGK
ncbi:MAG TPA: hypothetical protein VNI57_10670 [Candidatus Saccharimonadales bacterium]|nr:hypothetical protein [Candidatus Saccharimonadales bacterium]